MRRPGVASTVFLALACVCYLAAWTGVAVGLVFLGMFFEGCIYFAADHKDRSKNDDN